MLYILQYMYVACSLTRSKNAIFVQKNANFTLISPPH